MMSRKGKMNVLPDSFSALMKRALGDLDISEEKIASLKSVKAIKNEGKSWTAKHSDVIIAGVVFLVVFGFPLAVYRGSLRRNDVSGYIVEWYFDLLDMDYLTEKCIFPTIEIFIDPLRPPINCEECVNVTEVHIVKNLSQAEFLEKYAFSMQPVVIKDGQNGWTAKDYFSFEFFKEIYPDGSKAMQRVMTDCQFFPYQTNFGDLGEFFNMSTDRIEGNGEPWYVGWSNCDGKAANILRKHYEFPYFLPPELDHSKIDWVFMGLPGYGAKMHIDFVEGQISWQAQIKGTKKWILESPTECAWTCIRRMEIVVEPGDIIVLDANKWYHATLIMGNETSIVIGSEYY